MVLFVGNCYDLSYLHRHHHIESRFLKYGQEASSCLSSLKQPRKLKVQDLYGKNNYFKHRLMVVNSST